MSPASFIFTSFPDGFLLFFFFFSSPSWLSTRTRFIKRNKIRTVLIVCQLCNGSDLTDMFMFPQTALWAGWKTF